MRLWKLMMLSSPLMLNTALAGAEPPSANSLDLKHAFLLGTMPPEGSSLTSTPGRSARLFAADDFARKCAATCQEKRDACYGQCKASDNPKICQGACLDTYKTCKDACGN
jgi:hypothetical protein